MQNVFTRALPASALGLLLLTASCSEKENTDPTPAATWQVNGQTQSASNVLANDQNGQLEIDIWQNFSSSTSNGSAIVCTLYVPRQVGTFNLTGTSARASYSVPSGTGQSGDLYIGNQGNITVSSLANGYVSGTFTFSGPGFQNPQLTKTITAGKFTARLQ